MCVKNAVHVFLLYVGAVRVCWACRDGAIGRRKAENPNWVCRRDRIHACIRRQADGTEKFYPPKEWIPRDADPFCFSCDVYMDHAYNCRLCGEVSVLSVLEVLDAGKEHNYVAPPPPSSLAFDRVELRGSLIQFAF